MPLAERVDMGDISQILLFAGVVWRWTGFGKNKAPGT